MINSYIPSTPSCSIIIPSFNCPTSVVSFLGSIIDQLEASDEVIIVDDGSSRSHKKQLGVFIAQFHNPRIRLVFNNHGGVSHARNRGIKEARNELLLFTNQDSIARPEWVAQMKHSLCNADAVQGDFWTQTIESWIDRHHANWRRSVGCAKRQVSPGSFGVNTRNFGIRKTTLVAVCGPSPFRVDPNKHGGEDVLLGKQLCTAGITIVDDEKAVIEDGGNEHTLSAILRKKYEHGFSDSVSDVLSPDTFKYGNFRRTVLTTIKQGVFPGLALSFWLAYVAGAAKGSLLKRR